MLIELTTINNFIDFVNPVSIVRIREHKSQIKTICIIDFSNGSSVKYKHTISEILRKIK